MKSAQVVQSYKILLKSNIHFPNFILWNLGSKVGKTFKIYSSVWADVEYRRRTEIEIYAGMNVVKSST